MGVSAMPMAARAVRYASQSGAGKAAERAAAHLSDQSELDSGSSVTVLYSVHCSRSNSTLLDYYALID